MTDTITRLRHLDKIADEIFDEAGTCDADYAFVKAAARMIYNLRTALEAAEARAKRAEKEEGFLTAKLLQTGCLIIPHGSFFLENVPKIIARELQALKAENTRLRAELETARQLAASAHATAQAAWGGEIPSPLPGHKHMTEGDLAAMDARLDCPLCGGSGHIGDCDATAAGEVARLTADMQAVRVILRDFWQLLDLGGESWGRSFRGHLAEITMGLLDLHFEHNNVLRAEFEKDPEAFALCLWNRIQQAQQEAARRAVAGEGE